MSDDVPDGVGFNHIMFGRPWVGRYDRGWALAVAGRWPEGYYDSPTTAYTALYEFDAIELATLRPVWSENGQNRPVTMDDLDRLSRSLPPPWYWRFRRLRQAVIAADRVLPEWLKPWGWACNRRPTGGPRTCPTLGPRLSR